jgi:hypothetical protein
MKGEGVGTSYEEEGKEYWHHYEGEGERESVDTVLTFRGREVAQSGSEGGRNKKSAGTRFGHQL